MPGKRLATPSHRPSGLRILFFGDIVGKIGRRAVAMVLPKLVRNHQPDLVIANAENLAHGLGVTKGSLDEMRQAGVNVFTSGNNVWSKDGAALLATEPNFIRPANYPASSAGRGDVVVKAGKAKVLVLNLQGRVFMTPTIDDPLLTLDRLLHNHAREHFAAIVIDMHAEASSEKAALAWYADGRVSAVVGTHTHVQTADSRVLPKGTAFLTDLGMCGAYDSIIGTDVQAVLDHQLTAMPLKHIIPEQGPAQVNGAILDVDPKTGRALKLLPFSEVVEVSP